MKTPNALHPSLYQYRNGFSKDDHHREMRKKNPRYRNCFSPYSRGNIREKSISRTQSQGRQKLEKKSENPRETIS